MESSYESRFHPAFFDDLRNLNNKELEVVEKHIEKIKQDPLRFKHLRGKGNCYTIRIENMRIVYHIDGKIIWFLVIDRRDSVYDIYFKKLYSIQENLKKNLGS